MSEQNEKIDPSRLAYRQRQQAALDQHNELLKQQRLEQQRLEAGKKAIEYNELLKRQQSEKPQSPIEKKLADLERIATSLKQQAILEKKSEILEKLKYLEETIKRSKQEILEGKSESLEKKLVALEIILTKLKQASLKKEEVHFKQQPRLLPQITSWKVIPSGKHGYDVREIRKKQISSSPEESIKKIDDWLDTWGNRELQCSSEEACMGKSSDVVEGGVKVKSYVKLRTSPFFDVECDVPILSRNSKLGIFSKLHSGINNPFKILKTPDGIILHKNNTAPFGVVGDACVLFTDDYDGRLGGHKYKDSYTLSASLLDGFSEFCDSDKFRKKLDLRHGPDKMSKDLPGFDRWQDLRDGACETIPNAKGLFSRNYNSDDQYFQFIVSFNLNDRVLQFDFMNETLDDFLERFIINKNTLNGRSITCLQDIFDSIQNKKFFTNVIFLIIRFFQDVFGITEVNFYDFGCAGISSSSLPYSKDQSRREFAKMSGKFPGQTLGYGGKLKKTKKYKKKKTRKKLT